MIGENPIALGLFTSPIALFMIIWYSFLFITFDYLIDKLKLSDKNFFLLAAVLGIIVGGILDKEFFTTSSQFSFFGLEPLTTILVTLWWGASFVLLFHLVNIIIPREKVILGVWGAAIFTFLTIVSMGLALPKILSTVNPIGVLLLLLAVTVLALVLIKSVTSPRQDRRPVLQKSLKLSAVLAAFIIFSGIFGVGGYIILSLVLTAIVLAVMSRYQISI